MFKWQRRQRRYKYIHMISIHWEKNVELLKKKWFIMFRVPTSVWFKSYPRLPTIWKLSLGYDLNQIGSYFNPEILCPPHCISCGWWCVWWTCSGQWLHIILVSHRFHWKFVPSENTTKKKIHKLIWIYTFTFPCLLYKILFE